MGLENNQNQYIQKIWLILSKYIDTDSDSDAFLKMLTNVLNSEKDIKYLDKGNTSDVRETLKKCIDIIHEDKEIEDCEKIEKTFEKFLSEENPKIIWCLMMNIILKIFDVKKVHIAEKLHGKKERSKIIERIISGETKKVEDSMLNKISECVCDCIESYNSNSYSYYRYRQLSTEEFTTILTCKCVIDASNKIDLKNFGLDISSLSKKYKEEYGDFYKFDNHKIKLEKGKEVYLVPKHIQYRFLCLMRKICHNNLKDYVDIETLMKNGRIKVSKCLTRNTSLELMLKISNVLPIIDESALDDPYEYLASFYPEFWVNYVLYEHIITFSDEKLYLIANHDIVFYLTKFADKIREYKSKDKLDQKIKELKEKFKGKDVNTPLNMSKGLVAVQEFTQALKSKKKPLSDREKLLSMLRKKLDENIWPIFPNQFDYTEEDKRIFYKFIKDLDFIISLSDEKELDILERLYIDRHEYCYKEL